MIFARSKPMESLDDHISGQLRFGGDFHHIFILGALCAAILSKLLASHRYAQGVLWCCGALGYVNSETDRWEPV